MKFLVRPAFWLDLDRHHFWLAKNAGARLADRWLEAVWETVLLLSENPGLGRVRRDLQHDGVRSWVVTRFPRWTVFYGIKEDRLVLYRVEGGQRNLRRMLVG